MLKLTRTGIGLLTRQYRSVLHKCWLMNVGLFALGAATITAPASAQAEVAVLTSTLDKISAESMAYLSGSHATYVLKTTKGSNTNSIIIGGTTYYYTPAETDAATNTKLVNLANTGGAALVSSTSEPTNYVFKKDNGDNAEFYEDLMLLDSDKYFDKLPLSAIRYDAMMSFSQNRELRQKNIRVLNSISDELLDKMTRNENKKGHFAYIGGFLRTVDFDERVAHLEKYRTESPQLFNAMSKQAILDYLSDSDMYTEGLETRNDFIDSLYGITDKDKETAMIINFPADDEPKSE